MLALGAVKVLEDALAACKAGIVDRVMGAARVEEGTVELDPWQRGIAQSSAITNMALVLRIPEVTASSLVYHCMDLRDHFPDTMAAAVVAKWEGELAHPGDEEMIKNAA